MIDGWIGEIETEVLACLGDAETVAPREIAARLGISERAAVSWICLLASEDRLRIERVSAARRAPVGRDEDDGLEGLTRADAAAGADVRVIAGVPGVPRS